MKRVLSFLIALVLCLSLASFAVPAEAAGWTYDFMAPLWSGNTVLNEPFMPVQGVYTHQLLYPATRIISVRDATLGTVFHDYSLDANGNLVVTPGTAASADPTPRTGSMAILSTANLARSRIESSPTSPIWSCWPSA